MDESRGTIWNDGIKYKRVVIIKYFLGLSRILSSQSAESCRGESKRIIHPQLLPIYIHTYTVASSTVSHKSSYSETHASSFVS